MSAEFSLNVARVEGDGDEAFGAVTLGQFIGEDDVSLGGWEVIMGYIGGQGQRRTNLLWKYMFLLPALIRAGPSFHREVSSPLQKV